MTKSSRCLRQRMSGPCHSEGNKEQRDEQHPIDRVAASQISKKYLPTPFHDIDSNLVTPNR
jgi:hypothetical protein